MIRLTEKAIIKLEQTTADKIIDALLFLWICTLPIRNSIFTINIGGIPLYPNLVITTILTTLLLLCRPWKFTKFQSVALGLHLLFLLYIASWTLTKGLNNSVLFDANSHLMSFMTSIILFSTYNHYSWEKFKTTIVYLLRFYFILLMIFGIFEMISLYHIMGPNVSKLLLSSFNSTFIAPYFIYDNNNDYCLYLFISWILLYIFDRTLQQKPWLFICSLILQLFIAQLAQARLMIIVITVFIVVYGIYYLIKYLKDNKYNLQWKYIIGMLIIFVCLLSSKQYFNGKEYLSNYRSVANGFYLIDTTSYELRPFKYINEDKKHKIILGTEEQYQTYTESQSIKTRVALLKNGLEMVKKYPILGVGPGQFSNLHEEGSVQNETNCIVNPHNFVIELIAQYGLVGWLYFALIIYLLLFFIRRTFQHQLTKIILLLFIITYPILGIVPSAYLYINLHWLFLPLLVCLYTRSKSHNDI